LSSPALARLPPGEPPKTVVARPTITPPSPQPAGESNPSCRDSNIKNVEVGEIQLSKLDSSPAPAQSGLAKPLILSAWNQTAGWHSAGMTAALTAKEVCFVVKALIESGYVTADGLENLYTNQMAFLWSFLDGVMDGESSDYRRGDDLSAKGTALLEKLRALSADHREAIVRAAATTQALREERGISQQVGRHQLLAAARQLHPLHFEQTA
jgi:hypothetical protein